MACSSCNQNNHTVSNTVTSSTAYCDCACGCNEVVCPVIQPCTEIIDSNCVLYTGSSIYCNNFTIVPTNTTLNNALASMTNFICLQLGLVTTDDIFCGDEIVIPEGSSLQDALDLLSGLICDIELTPGPQGIQGIQGPQGIQGLAGTISPAGLTWQGTYSVSGTYVLNDVVGYGGASYYNILACSSCAGNPSSNTTNWALLANIGATGLQGIQGVAGAAGAGGNIGKQLGGGIVVAEWNEGGVNKALIASLTNLSTFLPWTIPAFHSTLIGATAQSYSTGFGNTNAIVAQTALAASTSYAAGIARLHNGGLFTDWYLPSIWELNMCYNSAAIVNKILGSTNGFITTNNYFSSTEYSSTIAWIYSFSSGLASSGSIKSSGQAVRAVRIHNL
jgi:hypothetical protein